MYVVLWHLQVKLQSPVVKASVALMLVPAGLSLKVLWPAFMSWDICSSHMVDAGTAEALAALAAAMHEAAAAAE